MQIFSRASLRRIALRGVGRLFLFTIRTHTQLSFSPLVWQLKHCKGTAILGPLKRSSNVRWESVIQRKPSKSNNCNKVNNHRLKHLKKIRKSWKMLIKRQKTQKRIIWHHPLFTWSLLLNQPRKKLPEQSPLIERN